MAEEFLQIYTKCIIGAVLKTEIKRPNEEKNDMIEQ